MEVYVRMNLPSLHTPFVHLAWTLTQINGPVQKRRKSSLSLWASTQNMKQSVSFLTLSRLYQPVHHFAIPPFSTAFVIVLFVAYFMAL